MNTLSRTVAGALLTLSLGAAGTGLASAGTPNSLPVKPVASANENSQALGTAAAELGLGTAVGSLTGTAVGATIGAGVGCAVGGVITAPTFVFVPLGCLAGMGPGLMTGAAIGGIVGTIAVGIPVLGVAGVELSQTLMAKPGESKWAHPDN